MIRIERTVNLDEVESKRLDNRVEEIMAERGYITGHRGAEKGYRFQEFDGASTDQEYRDFTNTIIADTLANRIPGILFFISWRLERSRLHDLPFM